MQHRADQMQIDPTSVPLPNFGNTTSYALSTLYAIIDEIHNMICRPSHMDTGVAPTNLPLSLVPHTAYQYNEC